MPTEGVMPLRKLLITVCPYNQFLTKKFLMSTVKAQKLLKNNQCYEQ